VGRQQLQESEGFHLIWDFCTCKADAAVAQQFLVPFIPYLLFFVHPTKTLQNPNIIVTHISQHD